MPDPRQLKKKDGTLSVQGARYFEYYKLHYAAGKTIEEIAEITDTKVVTIEKGIREIATDFAGREMWDGTEICHRQVVRLEFMIGELLKKMQTAPSETRYATEARLCIAELMKHVKEDKAKPTPGTNPTNQTFVNISADLGSGKKTIDADLANAGHAIQLAASKLKNDQAI